MLLGFRVEQGNLLIDEEHNLIRKLNMIFGKICCFNESEEQSYVIFDYTEPDVPL